MSVHEPLSTHDATEPPVKRARRRLGVSWPTIILFAAVITYVNGFWVTSLQGAVGALQRNEPPFQRWLRDSTIMLPIYAAGILVAVLLARRWVGRSPRAVVRGASAAVLIIAVCTIVGIAEVANSAAYDYRLQTANIDSMHEMNHTGNPDTGTPAPGIAETATPADASADGCVGVCAAKESTLGLHIRAVTRASALMLITNVLLVGWLLAVGGERLWQRPRATTTGADDT
jgi:hypothetical protein